MISFKEIVLAALAWPSAAGLALLGCFLGTVAASLFGCAPLQRLDPVFPGPAPALGALTPPIEAAPAPGHYAGDPVVVTVEAEGMRADGTAGKALAVAVAIAPSEYAYLLSIEAWALGWTDESGEHQPGLIDAYKLCATGRDADRDYCEEQVRARALALQACKRELPRAFAGGVGVGGVLGAGACGAVAATVGRVP